MHIFSSIRIRLTIWYISAFGVLLAAFSFYAYSLLASDLHERFDHSLTRSALATATYFAEFIERDKLDLGARETLTETQFGQLRTAIFKDGALLAASSPVVNEAIAATGILKTANRSAAVSLATDGVRNARLAAVVQQEGNTKYAVVVLEPLAELDNQLARMRRVFIFGIPGALLLAAAGGLLLAGKSLAPMVSISNQAEHISAQNLNSRLDMPHPSDEVGQLAKVINALLARLDSSFRVMREFMADASHELRTPLAIIQGEADVTLSQDRSNADYRKSLALIREQSRRMGRIVGDMLVLARADAGQQPLRAEEIYLNDLVEECCRAAQTLAGSSRIALAWDTGEDVPFRGDPELLRRMTVNLLDNAIHYTPPGGSVNVRLQTEDGSASLIVADSGIGIAPEFQMRVFDRFFRVQDSAKARCNGCGLGLSIVKLAAESHQGSVNLKSKVGNGSTFTVSLPLAKGAVIKGNPSPA